MISNFDEVKKQLFELSEVINKFKSEAVQLRIIEIVLGDDSSQEQAEDAQVNTNHATTKPRRRKLTRSKSNNKTDTSATGEKTTKKSRSSGQGAPATLTDLVDGNFFNTPKTISDIISHCDENLARRFKANEFSGKLARLTRDGTLSRKKNSDGQYEYTKA